jgi:hypothetical protein
MDPLTPTQQGQADPSVIGQQLFGNEPQPGQSGQTTPEATPAGGSGDSGQVTPPAPTNAPITMTSEQIRELVSGVAQQTAQGQQQAPRQLTPEELNTAMNVFSASPEHAGELLSAMGLQATPEQAQRVAAVLNLLLEGKTRQAVTMAAIQIEALRRNDLASLRNEVSPALAFAQQQRENGLREEFLGKYPDLKGMNLSLRWFTKE